MTVSQKKLSNPTEVFGRRLRELSSDRASYSQIARELGINRQQFARYLNGSSMPRDALLRKIAEYFSVDPGDLFQSQPAAQTGLPLSPAPDSDTAALMHWASRVEHEPISRRELPTGLYMQYKQSFSKPDRVLCMLTRIYRDDQKVVRCKRRYSVKVLDLLPGVTSPKPSYGMFIKVYGALVLFDIDGVIGDLVLSSFKAASMFSNRIKPGVVMTHGRPGNLGPMAGRHVFEKIPEGDSPLEWGRRQGFLPVSELSEQIRYHFLPPDNLPHNVMAVR